MTSSSNDNPLQKMPIAEAVEQSLQPTGSSTPKAANHPSWTEADEAWVAKLGEALKPLARKHGRACFQLVFHAGMANEALQILEGKTRGHQQATKALRMIQGMMNDLHQRVMKQENVSMEAFVHCKADVELVGSLAGPAEVTNASRIIVPTRH